MRQIKIYQDKKWQVDIVDSFTGDKITIDNYHFNKKPLSKDGYLKIEKVKEIINSEKPLYLFSEV